MDSAIGMASYCACIVLNSSIRAEGARRSENAYIDLVIKRKQSYAR